MEKIIFSTNIATIIKQYYEKIPTHRPYDFHIN